MKKTPPNVLLKQAREQRNWSQAKLAELAGTSATNVSRWERGITQPHPYLRERLCSLFGTPPQELGLLLDRGEGPSSTDTPQEALPREPGGPIYDPAMPMPLTGGPVGRDALLDDLRGRLCRGSSLALTALGGLPGVGKTTLAVTLAHAPDVRAHFSDGILWVGWGPHPNIPGLLARWGALLGVAEAQMARLARSDDWALALRSAMGERRLLLVIDDVWNLDDALAFQVGGPACAYVLTTRFTDIASLFASEGVTVPELSEDDGLILLAQLAPRAVEAEPAEAAALVRTVGGLPLALTLMGNYLRVHSQGGQPRRIHQALLRLQDARERMQLAQPQGILEAHPSLAPGTSLSLGAAIDTSMEVLDERARERPCTRSRSSRPSPIRSRRRLPWRWPGHPPRCWTV